MPVQQYVAIPGKGMIYGQKQASNPILMAGSPKKTKTRMAYVQKADVTVYEWAIQVFDRYPDKPTKLEPGKRIGFDVAVVDKDAASYDARRLCRSSERNDGLGVLVSVMARQQDVGCRRWARSCWSSRRKFGRVAWPCSCAAPCCGRRSFVT